ncbi:hypothetical protein Aglo03_46490 [Actinokineospora globicatena]|uniref:Uncharacterized protein n=1 Tax=Actinokineospora globicatena TaxID=103729 RepID=A0A9W6QNU6_9PSEU|nr:hypothetical protein Aglo03_46490 [Actinokineospora globicatena]
MRPTTNPAAGLRGARVLCLVFGRIRSVGATPDTRLRGSDPSPRRTGSLVRTAPSRSLPALLRGALL